jgi:hypothetical protein
MIVKSRHDVVGVLEPQPNIRTGLVLLW